MMPEARDRLSRQEDSLTTFSNRRQILTTGSTNVGRGNSVISVQEDEAAERQAFRTPFRWRGTEMVGSPGPMGLASRRGNIGTPRIGHAANFDRSTEPIIGRENLSPFVGSGYGRGRGSSILPSWYPRIPLQDITAVVRAIEKRRESKEEGKGVQIESSILQDRSTRPPIEIRPPIGEVPKILLNITNENDDEDSSCLTPQKKLLNNIDAVEKVVMEELRKLKTDSSAKKSEQEKRVRTLMSMR